MFTTEIKINGTMIIHIYGVNETRSAFRGEDNIYRYEYYRVEDREIKNGKVAHKREDGIEKLLIKIFQDAIAIKEEENEKS